MTTAQFYVLKSSFDGTRKAEPVHIEDKDIEMANLTEEDTNIEGTIYISSDTGRHGPRVKWYEKRPKNKARGYVAISIGSEPGIVADKTGASYPADTVDRVKEWVKLNRESLLEFWQGGEDFDRRQMNKFLDGLRKL